MMASAVLGPASITAPPPEDNHRPTLQESMDARMDIDPRVVPTAAFLPDTGAAEEIHPHSYTETHVRKQRSPRKHEKRRRAPSDECLQRSSDMDCGHSDDGTGSTEAAVTSHPTDRRGDGFSPSDTTEQQDHKQTAAADSKPARSLAIAGTETAATTLADALVLLGLHPEWQEAVRKEVDDVFRRGGAYLRTSTENDLSKFRIMDAVLKETLRLYPAIPNPPVSTEEDIQLEGTGYVIPRDSLVLVSLILLHRRPDNFPDPDKFDPGRFLEGGSARSLPPGSYLPFGDGSRKCVGGRYAFLEMKTVLAAVLRRFRVFPGSSREELEQVELSVSGSPVTGFRIICIPRSDQPANSVPHAVNT
ncbi:cytochrome P450 4V2-like [Schistocerca nitens]|uniref:cytochrome P450 4V2-like n=1 Tax=Schistocerca nitens TaxID=7011 RepID=UPI002119339D|nr:cytochrome P450 4V2-like [Schistocerca nitens]